jgi:hypothetical protein
MTTTAATMNRHAVPPLVCGISLLTDTLLEAETHDWSETAPWLSCAGFVLAAHVHAESPLVGGDQRQAYVERVSQISLLGSLGAERTGRTDPPG